jgi:hypothetical protein
MADKPLYRSATGKPWDSFDHGICDLIDHADGSGRFTFVSSLHANRFPEGPASISREDLMSAAELGPFSQMPFVSLKVNASKRAFDELDVQVVGQQQGYFCIDLNLCKLLHLPGIDPRSELAELRALFQSMRRFFEEHSDQRCSIRIVNEHRPLRAVVACNLPDPERLGFVKPEPIHTERIRLQIEQSATLRSWSLEIAKSLNRMGRYSWTHITELALYGPSMAPRGESKASNRLARP